MTPLQEQQTSRPYCHRMIWLSVLLQYGAPLRRISSLSAHGHSLGNLIPVDERPHSPRWQAGSGARRTLPTEENDPAKVEYPQFVREAAGDGSREHRAGSKDLAGTVFQQPAQADYGW